MDLSNYVGREQSFVKHVVLDTYLERFAHITGLEREFAAVNAYAANLARTGQFDYVCKAIILNPSQDKTHYNLIYATRSSKGVSEFKKAEKSAMEQMETARALARQRDRTKKTGQNELFTASAEDGDKHFDELRETFLDKAKSGTLSDIKASGSILYDELWKRALQYPLIWESDLKEWLKVWRGNEVDYSLPLGQRVPKLEQEIQIKVRDQQLPW
jgi:hypothetical protein